MKLFASKELKQKRSELRNEMPEPERLLWYQVRGKRLGTKFRRQQSIGPFIVDFYCPSAKLIVEADGDSHFDERGIAHDRSRDR